MYNTCLAVIYTLLMYLAASTACQLPQCRSHKWAPHPLGPLHPSSACSVLQPPHHLAVLQVQPFTSLTRTTRNCPRTLAQDTTGRTSTAVGVCVLHTLLLQWITGTPIRHVQWRLGQTGHSIHSTTTIYGQLMCYNTMPFTDYLPNELCGTRVPHTTEISTAFT